MAGGGAEALAGGGGAGAVVGGEHVSGDCVMADAGLPHFPALVQIILIIIPATSDTPVLMLG